MENLVHLDTHVVVWLYGGEIELIPNKIKELLNEGNLIISPIVLLELQYLYEIKRIKKKSGEIFSVLEKELGLRVDQSNFQDIISRAIEYNWTRDPFDRIIAAQASSNSAVLITKEFSLLENYKNAGWS